MTSTKIGALRIDIGADTAQFDKGLSDVQRKLAGVGKSFEAVGARLTSIGGKLSIGMTAPLLAIGAASIKGAQEQAAAMAQVEAALKSMGDASGRTSDQLLKSADALELKSLFNADEILKKSTANLLTFGKVSGEVFDRAQQAAVDLATRMDGDLQAATLMVGKALNDPVKGLTALSRAGIQFTAQQKEQIKAMSAAGNVAGAQAIMLGELEKQFGGAAAAAAKADPMREVMVKLGQAGDKIGEALLPLIPPLTDAIVGLLDAFTGMPEPMQETVLIVAGLAAALGPVLVAVGTLTSGIGVLLPVVAKLGPVLTVIGTALSAAIPLIWGAVKAMAAMALTPVGAVITAIAVAVGAVYLAWKNWDKIEPVIRNLYNGVKTWIVDRLGAVWDWLKGKLAAVGKWFYDLYDAVVGHSYIPDMVDQIGKHIARLDGNMVKPVKGMTAKATEAFKQMQTDIAGILTRLFPEASAVQKLEEDLAKLDSDMAKKLIDPAVWAEARARLVDELSKAQADAAKAMSDAAARRVGLGSSEEIEAEFAKSIGEADYSDLLKVGDNIKLGLTEAQERMRETFRNTFGDGVRAALAGDLKGFFEDWLARATEKAFSRGLDMLADFLFEALGSGKSGGLLDGIGKAIGGLFGGGGGGGGGSSLMGTGGIFGNPGSWGTDPFGWAGVGDPIGLPKLANGGEFAAGGYSTLGFDV